MTAEIAYVLLVVALVLAAIKIVRGLMASESRELLQSDTRRWRRLLRAARQTFGAARRAHDRSELLSPSDAMRNAVARDLFLDERPSHDEVAARLVDWVSSPDSRPAGEAADRRFDPEGRPLVAEAAVDRLVDDTARLNALFEEAAADRGLPCTRRSLETMFPCSAPISRGTEPRLRAEGRGGLADEAGAVAERVRSPLQPLVESRRPVGRWDYLRLVRGYGWLSRIYAVAATCGKLGIFFSIPLVAIWVWKRSMPVEPGLVPEASGGLGPIALPIGLFVLAAVLALPAYFRVIVPRIKVLLEGPPCRGRVELIAVSTLGRAKGSRTLKRVRWLSLDETRSGLSFPVSASVAGRFQEGQEIEVYCDSGNDQGGEIDVLGVLS